MEQVNVLYNQRSEYDIASAVERQRNFNYQVNGVCKIASKHRLQTSLPHYGSKHYMSEAADRYRKYLSLKGLYPQSVFPPCYDIDVVWHAHQMHTREYANDTTALLGRV